MSVVWNAQPKQSLFLREVLDPEGADEIFYGGAAGGGKGQRASDVIATPYGMRKVEEIDKGDRVCSPYHGNTTVIDKFDLGVRDIYRVEFADGTHLDVTEDHIWLVSYVRKGRDKKGLRYRLQTTNQLMEQLKDGYYEVQIPLPEPIQFTKAYRYDYRKIDPYTLGVLLGDGCFSTQYVRFYTEDEKIKEKIKEKYDVQEYDSITCSLGKDIEVRQYLEKLKLMGKKSAEKFIPEQYLYGDIESRFELARGLMDADGYVDERGHLEFSTVSRQLAKDMAFLLRSLGLRVTMSSAIASYLDGERKQDKYRLYIQGKNKIFLFNLKRKKDRVKIPRTITHKKITEIYHVGVERAYCIKVDNPDGLYIAGKDLIVTHNTDALLIAGIMVCEKFPGAHVLFLRKTLDELQMKPIPRSKELIPTTLGTYSEKWNRWVFHNGSVLQFTYLKLAGDENRFQSGEFPLVIFDELTGFEEHQYKFLLSRNRTSKEGIVPKIVSASNPGGIGHTWVKARFIDFGPPYKVREAPQDEVQQREGALPRKRLFIPAVLEDNQILVKADPYYKAKLLDLDESHRQALLYGNWDAFSGKVFKELSVEEHAYDPRGLPKNWNRIMAIDWGYAKPFCVLWGAIDPYNYSRLYVYREYYGIARDHAGQISPNQGVKLNPSYVAQKIKQVEEINEENIDLRVGGHDMFRKDGRSDTAFGQPKTISDYFSAQNVSIVRANNDRLQGKAALHEYMKFQPDGTPKLLINRYNSHLWRTLPALPHSKHNPEDVDDGPSVEDHAYEALRYLVMAAPTVEGHPEEVEMAEWESDYYLEESLRQRDPYTGY